MSEFNEFVNIYNNAVNIYRKYIGKRYVNQHVKSIRLTSNEYKFLNDYLYGKFFENFNELKNKDRKYDNPYGEVTYEGFNVLLRELNLREKDVFVDMGSGVGQLLFQASALTEVEKVIGIESLSYPINKSREMKKEFIKLMRFGRFLHCPITLLEGDFFDNQFKKYINEGTHLLIHSSNRSPQFYYDMEEKIIRNLSDGTKFLSSTTFRVSRTINKRNVNNVGSILKVLKEITERNLVSYKDAEATFTLYLVDRRDVKMYLREKEFDKRRRRSPRFLNFI
uniref:Histone-lysine N-methyltransferase, H3 lysine-79 specific n=1 Tax=Parastrongyloides trichosuri TaxID=131310 RepID=A0A0N5A337_PARTI